MKRITRIFLRGGALAALAAVLLQAPGANAQQHANQARGFNANGVYQQGDVDSVNLFNGNLTVDIPIGQAYSTNDGFSYRLRLVYNSNLWNFREVCLGGVNFSYEGFYSSWFIVTDDFTIWGSWDLIPSDDFWSQYEQPRFQSDPNPCLTVALPNPAANAGHGWQLTLGSLYQPRGEDWDDLRPWVNESGRYLYVSPDGSEHLFFDALHAEEAIGGPSAPPIPDPEWSYTRDGSYLRMHTVSPSVRTIEFPNGEIHTFETDPAVGDGWRLERIDDRFGNGLAIEYQTNKWVLRDSTGRVHEVIFASPGTNVAPVLSEVRLARFGDDGNQDPAVYSFEQTPVHLPRACPSHPELATTHVDVARLDAVVFPDGQRYRMLDYDNGATNVDCAIRGALKKMALPTGAEVSWSFMGAAGSGPGSIFDPARRWMSGYVFPQGSSPRAYSRGNVGVRQRTVHDPVANTTDVWHYDPHLFCSDPDGDTIRECFDFNLPGPNQPNPPPPRQYINVVTAPDGAQTVNYFSVFSVSDDLTEPQPADWNPNEYGLPMTKDVWDQYPEQPANEPKLYLSWEVFPAGVDPFPIVTDPANPPPRHPLRAGYVRYEFDTPVINVDDPTTFYSIPDSGFGEAITLNRREAANRTVFFEDGARAGHKDVWRSGWDGLGHFRTMELKGDVAGSFANATKTAFTNFNDGRGTYPGDFTPVATSSTWLTELYTRIDRSQQGSSGTFSTRYCFDPTTGFLDGTRQLKNPGAGEQSKDLVTRFERTVEVLDTANGIHDTRVSLRELHYGGDGSLGNSSTPAGCGGATTPAAEYRIDRIFRWGALETEMWVNDFNGDLELLVQDSAELVGGSRVMALDRNTGLQGAAMTADGLVTRFAYDEMGRLTRTTPDNNLSAVTVHEYQILLDAGGNARGGRVDTCTLPARSTANCSSPSSTTRAFALVDGLGRIQEQQRRYPGDCNSGSCWAKQRLQQFYAPNERHEHIGSWEPAENIPSQTHWTKKKFDTFGRLTLVQEPRGGIWETLFDHEGATSTREAHWIFQHVPNHAEGGQLAHLARWQVRDLSDRLVNVTELSDESSPQAAITRYEYDADDHLTKVLMFQADAKGEAEVQLQSREFGFDGRGFMTRQKLPELGASGNGEVFFTYDSMGHVLTKTFDDPTPVVGFYNLTYEYDRAGRLVRLSGQPTPEAISAQPIEERFYARVNSPNRFGRFSAGKLVQSKRYNPEADVRVTETFVFNGDAGDLSSRHVRASDVRGTLSYRQEFAFDSLGNLVGQDYPEPVCPTGPCVGAPPSRAATYVYQDAHLVRVLAEVQGQPLEVAQRITYHPNDLVSEVTHKNYGNAAGTFVTTWERIFNDEQGLPRPSNIQHLSSGGAGWNSFAYGYDTAGNIFQIGDDRFAYDGAGRLQWSRQTVEENCSTPPCNFEVEYDYDIPGNIQAIRLKEDGVAVSRPVTGASTATNRLTGSGTTYDRAGNLTLWDNRMSFVYDSLNRVASQGTQGAPKQMVYNADGERVFVKDYQLDASGSVQIWRLRGLNNEVLREVRRNSDGTWSWQRDYLYRDQLLLSQVTPVTGGETLSHLYLDHLGTPRHTSGQGGVVGAYREYMPFGEEVTKPRHEQDFLQFTGHERDFNCLTGAGSACAEGSFQARVDDLDYMHARFYSPWNARFFSVDPKLGRVETPLSWNRYAYALDNPVQLVDPDGEAPRLNYNGVNTVFDYIFQRHVSREAAEFTSKSKFKKESEAYAKRLIQETFENADRRQVQGDGRIVLEKSFSSSVGTEDQRIVRVVVEQVGEEEFDLVNAFPTQSFRLTFENALSFVPWIGTFFLVRDVFDGEAQKIHDVWEEHPVDRYNESVREMMDAGVFP